MRRPIPALGLSSVALAAVLIGGCRRGREPPQVELGCHDRNLEHFMALEDGDGLPVMLLPDGTVAAMFGLQLERFDTDANSYSYPIEQLQITGTVCIGSWCDSCCIYGVRWAESGSIHVRYRVPWDVYGSADRSGFKRWRAPAKVELTVDQRGREASDRWEGTAVLTTNDELCPPDLDTPPPWW